MAPKDLCLHGGGGPQLGEVTCGRSPHLSCKRHQINMRDYMDRRVTPPKRVTPPTWGPPPPCKQALKRRANVRNNSQQGCVRFHGAKSLTKFKLCATTSNNMQQGVQEDATCNIQQCWELLVNNNVAFFCTQL